MNNKKLKKQINEYNFFFYIYIYFFFYIYSTRSKKGR